MLYVDRTNVSEDIDVNKAKTQKECIVCHYRYFLENGFKLQRDVCNECHDVLMMSSNLNDIVILNICGVDYYCIINEISQSEAVNLLLIADLSEKSGTLQNLTFLYHV